MKTTSNATPIHELARQQGLLLLGACDLAVLEDAKRLDSWLNQGMAGDMTFMMKNLPLRQDPRVLWPQARSALVFAIQYGPEPADDPIATARHRPSIAKYAMRVDYHKAIKKRLNDTLARWEKPPGMSFKICVDSIPLLERALARKTGAGFIGKNSCYISHQYGSFLLLGVVLLSTPIEELGDLANARQPFLQAEPMPAGLKGECGTCRRCMTHCPTGAIVADRVVDARKCLAYWSIEHRGLVPKIYWPHFKRSWFGCDICQDVCPFNRRAKRHADADLPLRFSSQQKLQDVATMDQTQYEQWFGGSSMTRAKRQGLQRNALIALWATGATAALHQAGQTLRARDGESELVLHTLAELLAEGSVD